MERLEAEGGCCMGGFGVELGRLWLFCRILGFEPADAALPSRFLDEVHGGRSLPSSRHGIAKSSGEVSKYGDSGWPGLRDELYSGHCRCPTPTHAIIHEEFVSAPSMSSPAAGAPREGVR